MRLLTSALLGTAAVLTAAVGAQAADLPSRKAAPAEYVKICDVYGRGFYYIPGTNTCLKVGGRVRFELGWHKAQNTWQQAGTARGGQFIAPVTTVGIGTTATNMLLAGAAGGTFTNGARQDTLGWRARAYVNMDARTQTAWGTVQTVFSISLRSRSGIFVGNPLTGPGGQETASPQVYAAYIRFAGFTVGRAPWIFANGPGYLFYWTNHSGGSAIGTMQLAYTATFGGGFSATIALEDKDDFARQRTGAGTFTNYIVTAPATVTFLNLNAGWVQPNRLPNLVLTLRLDQGWGHIRVSGAVGRNHSVYNNGNGVAGTNPMRTFNKTGWAVGADAKINLPQLAQGDALYFYAAYANGLTDYASGGNTVNGSVAKDGRISGGYVPTHNNWNLFACAVDGVGAITAICGQNTKALAAMIAFTHYWTPTLRSNFAVSYLKFTPGSRARSVDWFLLGGQPTSQAWQGSASLIWSPTAGFDIGLEVYYARLKNKLACNNADYAATGYQVVVGNVSPCTPWGSATLSPTTVGVSQNPSDWSVKMRVERTF